MFKYLSMILFHGAMQTPVRATLDDGQVLMGEVKTKVLLLQSGSGLLEVPLEDVGEVVPATGGLGQSEGRVDVWLRNGSELHGTWADPKLAMDILIGGDEVSVDLPMNDLSRFQLQGDAAWPTGPVYRMRTRFGDDFLVDPARTHLVVTNKFGTFSPLLSECVAVAPVAEATGDWRIQLQTGTVLIGHLQENKLTVALPMGPDQISVALDQFVSLRMEYWSPAPASPGYRDDLLGPSRREEQPVHELSVDVSSWEAPRGRQAPVEAPPAAAASGWFDSAALSATKQSQPE